MRRDRVEVIEPIPPPPPVVLPTCQRIATNQIGDLEVIQLLEPIPDEAGYASWHGVDSSASGIHQAFRYEQLPQRPPPEIIDQFIISGTNRVLFSPGNFNAQPGDAIVVFANVVGDDHVIFYWDISGDVRIFTASESQADGTENTLYMGILHAGLPPGQELTPVETGVVSACGIATTFHQFAGFHLRPGGRIDPTDVTGTDLDSDATPDIGLTTVEEYTRMLACFTWASMSRSMERFLPHLG